MTQASPLDDFRRLVVQLPKRSASVPSGDRLTDMAHWLAAAQRRPQAAIRQPVVAVFAGSHGVARHGVSLTTAAEISESFAALERGTAVLNGICSAYNIGLKALELALDVPTGDVSETAALDERSAAATIAFGMESLAGGADLLILASMGAGGETVAAALGAALNGGDFSAWAESVEAPRHIEMRRLELINRSLQAHGLRVSDPLEALGLLGGREIAAIAGAIAAAASQNTPVILDGETAVAAALMVHRIAPNSIGHCMLAHRLPSPAFAAAAQQVGLTPLLDLGLWQGDGRAGALAAGIALAAARIGAGEAV